ncbi:MarR family transcriptional regulator [Arthrobacter sp. MDT1-48-3]
MLDFSTASMTTVADRLKSAGFVQRRPNRAERRKICLLPTKAGI